MKINYAASKEQIINSSLTSRTVFEKQRFFKSSCLDSHPFSCSFSK